MKDYNKIHDLWRYLGLQDDDTLIIRVSESRNDPSHYMVITNSSSGLRITEETERPDLSSFSSFYMLQQLDTDRRYVIPSVEDMEEDRIRDY